MDSFVQDVKYAARMLGKSPRFAATVVATLALGIGVNTASFTAFNTVLRPYPIAEPDQVVHLRYQPSKQEGQGAYFSYPHFAHLRQNARAFSEVLARAEEKFLVAAEGGADGPEEVSGEFVSENYFPTLGGKALMGRTFSADENRLPGQDAIVILNHYYWKRRFGSAPGIVGQNLRLNGKPFTVIGVTAPDFVGLRREMPALWLPLMMRGDMPSVYERTFTRQNTFEDPGTLWLDVYGRLRPGRTLEEAQAEARVLLSQVDTEGAALVQPLFRVDSGIVEVMLVVFAATGIVLLIACSNLANLMLARGAERQREIGVRLSLGASRGRVVRQLLTEGMALATLGAGGGLLLAWWSVELLKFPLSARYGGPAVDSVALHLTPDWRVLAFTALLAVVCCVAFALAPALRATRTDLAAVIKDDGATFGRGLSRSWLRHGLVAAQVALSLLLLIPAGLLLRGLSQVASADPGFETKRVLHLGYGLELSGYDEARAELFHHELVARLKARPDVVSVSMGFPPSTRYTRAVVSTLDGDAKNRRAADGYYRLIASPTFFDTAGTPVVHGRTFAPEEIRDGLAADVVIISRATAEHLWPGEEPLGKTLRVEREIGSGRKVFFPSLRVIGVARDAQTAQLGAIPAVFLYVPQAQDQWKDVALLVRTSRSAAELKPEARAMAQALEPTVRLWISTVEEDIGSSKQVVVARAVSDLGGALGVLALTLAAVGLGGVMAYSVSQRTREIGIRMALGAQRPDVLRLFVGQGLRMVSVGAALGVAGGAATAQVMRSLLFGLSPADPAAYSGVLLGLLLVALAAILIPARRAAQVDPMVALRHE